MASMSGLMTFFLVRFGLESASKGLSSVSPAFCPAIPGSAASEASMMDELELDEVSSSSDEPIPSSSCLLESILTSVASVGSFEASVSPEVILRRSRSISDDGESGAERSSGMQKKLPWLNLWRRSFSRFESRKNQTFNFGKSNSIRFRKLIAHFQASRFGTRKHEFE